MKTTRIEIKLQNGKKIVYRVGETVKRNQRPSLDIVERTEAANALRRAATKTDRSTR